MSTFSQLAGLVALLGTLHGSHAGAADQGALYPPRATPVVPAAAECLTGPMAGLELRKPFSPALVQKVVSDKTLPSSTARFVHFTPKVDAMDGVDYVARINARTGDVIGIDLWIHLQNEQLFKEQVERIRDVYAREGFPSVRQGSYRYFSKDGLMVSAAKIGQAVLYYCEDATYMESLLPPKPVKPASAAASTG
jgi:hypothetical protein